MFGFHTRTKNEIRNNIRAQKSLLTAAEKLQAADSVFEQLERHAAFIMAKNILMYHALPDEVPTLSFIRKWCSRKNFYLPRVNGLNLEILPYDEQHLALGSFHIEEPTGNDTTSIDNIELIIVPAVAYDREGNRLGRGKGYYDRLLSEAKAVKVGIVYHFQLLDNIPAESHDVPVDIIITERLLHTPARK